MKEKYWLGAAAGALAVGLMAASAQAAPLSTGGNDVRVTAGDISRVQSVHWDRPYGYYYYPRRHYREYGYRDSYRPYRYNYGYGPGYGYYDGPRYYRRGWW
jgi:hypothetical protein